MANVFVVQEDGSTKLMDRVRCADEDRELQVILEKNPDLLPGEQIDPEDPRRWLLIKREMPVQDPNTGWDRWSIDFFFADQDAIPTFVECKRFADTRSRREVVGQMFEYAANGHFYWTKEMIRTFANQSATQRKSDLDEGIRALQPNECESSDAYFERLQENLREGQVRIIFFMEESPMELRSVVDFLNKQMERSEVLLVEARQYSCNGSRIVVPTLFGYTEEARRVKRTVTVTNGTTRKKWDRVSFFADAQQKLTPADLQTIEAFYNRCAEMPVDITWGTGKDNGSLTIRAPSITSKSLLCVLSKGTLALNFGWFNGSDHVERARDRFKDLVGQKTGLKIPDDYARRWLNYPISEWGGKVGALADALAALIDEFHVQ